MSAVTEVSMRLLKALRAVHRDIFVVDLNTGTADHLFSERARGEERISQWDPFFYEYSSFMYDTHRSQALAILSCAGLQLHYEAGQTRFTLEYPFKTEQQQKWLSFTVVIEEERQEEATGLVAYITVAKASQDEFLRKLANRYTYNKGDEFVCVDTMNDRYIVLDGPEGGATLLPNICIGYKAAVKRYTELYTVPEDVALVRRAADIALIKAELAHKEVYCFSSGERDKEGRYRHKQWQYRYYDRETQIVLLRRTDITEVYEEKQRLKAALDDARQLAERDSLTGVFNHRSIEEKVSRSLRLMSDFGALLFLDLDNFKQINDIFGHQAGDEVLRHAVAVMRKAVQGEPYYIGRTGGDEFIVFLPYVASCAVATQYAEDICRHIQSVAVGTREMGSVSASIGIALAPSDGRDYESLVRTADSRAYRAKKEGKNRYAVR